MHNESFSNSLHSSDHKSGDSEITKFLVKASGIFLIVNVTLLSRFMLRVYSEHLYCNRDFEVELGCKSKIREVGSYLSIFGVLFLILCSLYSDLFATKMFPDLNIPWAGWNDKAPFLRTLYKIAQTISIELIGDSYVDIMNFALLVISMYMIYDRYVKPSLYNKYVGVTFMILES